MGVIQIASSGISEGDKVEITGNPDGSIVIQKKKKDASQLKAFGVLHRFANPELISLEDDAFAMAMEERCLNTLMTGLLVGIRFRRI